MKLNFWPQTLAYVYEFSSNDVSNYLMGPLEKKMRSLLGNKCFLVQSKSHKNSHIHLETHLKKKKTTEHLKKF